MNKKDSSRFSHFLNGKGFYAALALCLVGAGTAAWVVVDKTLGSITEPPASSQMSTESEEQNWGFPATEETGKPKADISVSSESSALEQSSSSVSEASSVLAEQYEQPTLAPEQQISVYALPITSAEVFNQFSNGDLVHNSTLSKWCTHDGIDLKAEKGAEVLCTAEGVVSRVYNNGIWGKTVEVTHVGDIVSIYSGLSEEVPVHEGDLVTINQTLGTVGSTNLAEAKLESHLHFAMKQGEKFLNPLATMGVLKQ